MQMARYPGVRPFEQFQKDIFFGRERDILELYNLVMIEKIVALFGRSGYGKSSLINAGLTPLLHAQAVDPEKKYLVLNVRPGSYVEGHMLRPLKDRVVMELQKSIPPNAEMDFLDTLCENHSLWYYFKQRYSKENSRFLLIFDQFEEFFTHPLEQQKQFTFELTELLYETIPQEVRRVASELAEAHYDLLAQPMEIKVLFAIRGDRLALLDRLKNHLPTIFNRRFELKALNVEQAKLAIVQPAILPTPVQQIDTEGAGLQSPPFEYDPKALEIILDHLTTEIPGQDSRVEAFQLQIICSWIEDQVREGRIMTNQGQARPVVFPADLPDFSTIFHTYYKQQISKLPDGLQEVAEEMVENELLFINPQSGDGRRISVDKDLLIYKLGAKGLNEDILKALEDTFLLRRELNTQGGVSYEISHDALIDPIVKSRAKRLEAVERQLALEKAEKERQEAETRAKAAEEERREAEQRALEAEERALVEAKLKAEAMQLQAEAEAQRSLAEHNREEALRQKNEALQQRKVARQFTNIAIVLVVISLLAGLWGWRKADQVQKTLSKLKKESARRELMEHKQFIKQADDLFEGNYYNSALKDYLAADSLRKKNPEDTNFIDLSRKIKNTRNRIKNNRK